MKQESVNRSEDDVAARLEREARFHDAAFANDVRRVTDKYYNATRESSERYRQLVLERANSARVLEYGCGTGSLALEIVARNGNVTGIDISPGAIDMARSAADALGVPQARADFAVMNAEALEFPTASFDVVCGSGILHHLDLQKAYAEIRRVLRPGGCAIFFEPLGHNVLINLYRRLTPRLRTPDEHPLLRADIALASKHFTAVDVEYFHFFCIASAWLPPALDRLYRPMAQRFDRLLMNGGSPFKTQAWMSVLRLS